MALNPSATWKFHKTVRDAYNEAMKVTKIAPGSAALDKGSKLFYTRMYPGYRSMGPSRDQERVRKVVSDRSVSVVNRLGVTEEGNPY